jgi:hypothetical protein
VRPHRLQAVPSRRAWVRAIARDAPGLAAHQRWALLRGVLGLAQVFGASLGVFLIVGHGLTAMSLAVFVLTTICTCLSVILFRIQKRDRA